MYQIVPVLYPLKFRKVFKEKVWGGRSFNTFLGLELPENKNIGESWEVSTHENGISIVDNGYFKDKTISDILDYDSELLLGEEVVKKYDGKFPLLIKFLDINDKLSIQVHPDNSYAIPNENEFGKEESWYVMDASDDAEIIIGFNPGITEKKFKDALEQNNLESIFNRVKVKKGDILNVKPGTVHGTHKGSVLICEVQQNSDVTYRVYDYNRIIDGSKRDLHINKALDVISYDLVPDLTSVLERKEIILENAVKDNLTHCEFYTMERYKISNMYKDGSYKNFRIYSVLDGEGEIYMGSELFQIRKGETFLIPANLDINIYGNKLELLKIYI